MSKGRKKVQLGSVAIVSNLDGELAELEQFLQTIDATKVRAEVWTDVEYAIYVEYGTVYMLPRAMIRRSIPAIEAKFAELWQQLSLPFTEAQITKLFKDTVDFARDEIARNTPRQSGRLQESWKASEVEYT